MKTVEEIVENYAASLDMPPKDPKTIDRVIEVLATGASWSKEQKELLRQVANAKDYSGNNPNLMLLLYDILGGNSKKALAYGIQAFEIFKRDPKKLVELENPDRLVEYVIVTAERLEELVKLKDTLLVEGYFYSVPRPIFGYSGNLPKKRLVTSVLLVANEIAYRLKDIDMRNEEAVSKLSHEEFMEFNRQWRTRLDAHIAIVLAYQAKGKKVDNKEALEALEAYEAVAGTYQYDKFAIDLMRAYATKKYGVNKLSTGEIPEHLKADPEAMYKPGFRGGIDWDQYFRQQWFGTKEPEWERKERAQQEGRARSGNAQVEELVDRLFRDPWEVYAKELGFLGLTKEMSYQEARAAFRKGIMAHRSTFVRMDFGTPEYETAMKETAGFLDAWNKVEVLYAAKK